MKFPSSTNNSNSIVLNYDECYAKTIITIEGQTILGSTVKNHCELVGFVARYLLRLLPKKYWDNKLPNNIDYIAALHDIGKVYPSFQYKIYEACNKFPLGKNHSLLDDKTFGYHTAVGEACFQNVNKKIAKIIGQHHGYINSNIMPKDAEIYGGPKWQHQRELLTQDLSLTFNSTLSEKEVLDFDLDLELAIVVISDWIGSSIQDIDNSFDLEDLKEAAKKAVKEINFSKPEPIRGLSFEQIFGFKPRTFQKQFIDIAKTEGVYILEAPMGSGKTEAALYIAYNQLEDKNGLYFALPTRLTSNTMHKRTLDFINVIDSKNKVYLIHGGHNKTILGDHDKPGFDWFDSKKRSLLALYGVGTIDQALMSILNVKHHELRKFGLAGKIIIFDEVHTYDTYTSTLLKQLIKELKKLNSTIIILSATLTKRQNIDLLNINENCLPQSLPYPCCTFSNSDGVNCIKLPIVKESKINIILSEKTQDIIDMALDAAYAGQQVLWIENTVSEAQEIYKVIASRSDSHIEIGLIHSKFTQSSRNKNESYWVNILSKDGCLKRLEKGRIIIGTQVLEQSLDIDSDLLVTRLAPIDMIFQRTGRLWRHNKLNKYRPKSAICNAVILIEPDSTSKHFPFLKGKTSYVYDRYVLARTLEVIQSANATLTFPNDIRLLVDKVYEEREETGALAFYKNELEKNKDRLSSFALTSIKSHGNTLSDDILGTRYSDSIETKVLLISKVIAKHTDKITLLLLTGKTIELSYNNTESLDIKTEKAFYLENEIITVQDKIGGIKDPFLSKCLSNYIYLKEVNCEYFLVAKVNNDRTLSTLEGKSLQYSYSSKIGLFKN